MKNYHRLSISLLFLLGILSLPAWAADTATGVVFHDANENGKPDNGERRLQGVGVSNGREIVDTNADGRYEIAVDDDTIVFVLKPSGWRPTQDANGISRFYYIHKPNG